MRRSAASQRSRAVLVSPAAAAMRASASRAKTSTGASSSSRASSRMRHETFLGAWDLVRGVQGGQQALAERGLLAAAGVAVPRSRGFEGRPRLRDLSDRTQNPAQMDPGERRQAHIAGGLRLVDRELQGGGASCRSRRPGTALDQGSMTWYASVCWKPSRRERCGCATEVEDGIVEPVLDPGQFAEHRVAANVQPRVVHRSQPALDLVGGLDAALVVAGGDRRSGGEERSSRPGPTAGPACRRRRGCDRSAPSPDGTRRDATRRRRGSRSSAPAGRGRRVSSASSVATAMWLRASSR